MIDGHRGRRPSTPMFRDREHAGRQLAATLDRYRSEGTVVLGLARGGVRVALEVAGHLGARLEALAVHRIHASNHAELALGAIAEGHALYVSPDALHVCGVDEAELEALAERESRALAEDVRVCRGNLQPPDVAGRTVILVDEGAVSGASACAAIRAARRWGASHVVFAAPVV